MPSMLRPQKFEFDAKDQMPDGGCSLYSVLHPPSSALHPPFSVLRPPTTALRTLPPVLLQQSMSLGKSPAPTPTNATPVFFLHVPVHKPRTDTDIPTPSASPRPVAKGDIPNVLSCYDLAFAFWYLLLRKATRYNFFYPHHHPKNLLLVTDDCLFSKIFHPRKRGKMPILGP